MAQKQDLSNFMSRFRKAGIYFFVFVIAILGVAAIVQRQAIYDQLYDWKLIPRPERLTELYFTEHTKLPKTYAPGQQQAVAFTVHNIEYRRTAYNYTVSQLSKDGKTSQQLADGSFTLDHDKTKELTVPVALADMGARAQVKITLTYDGIAFGQDEPSKQTQAIYYWLTEGGKENGTTSQL